MLVEIKFCCINISMQGDVRLHFDHSLSFLEIIQIITLLESSIMDSQSFVLNKNWIEFHQECNGSIHI